MMKTVFFLSVLLSVTACKRLDDITYSELVANCTNSKSEECIQNVSFYVHDTFNFNEKSKAGYCVQFADKAKNVLKDLNIGYKQLFCNADKLNEDGHTVIVANGLVIDNLQWRFVYPESDIPYNCD